MLKKIIVAMGMGLSLMDLAGASSLSVHREDRSPHLQCQKGHVEMFGVTVGFYQMNVRNGSDKIEVNYQFNPSWEGKNMNLVPVKEYVYRSYGELSHVVAKKMKDTMDWRRVAENQLEWKNEQEKGIVEVSGDPTSMLDVLSLNYQNGRDLGDSLMFLSKFKNPQELNMKQDDNEWVLKGKDLVIHKTKVDKEKTVIMTIEKNHVTERIILDAFTPCSSK